MLSSVVLILVVIRVVEGEETEQNGAFLPEIQLPQKCMMPSNFPLKQCCMFPPFFYGKVTRSCGAVMSVVQSYTENKVVVIKSHTPGDNCKYWSCVLKKYDILDIDGAVDEDKWQMHLRRWLQRNPLFNKVLESAKSVCTQRYAVLFPLNTCEFFRYVDCYRSRANMQCPVTINTPECKSLKEFYEECGKYYEILLK